MVMVGAQKTYPDFELSGIACHSGYYNGVWAYAGNTADGRPYYEQYYLHEATDQRIYIYFDKDCVRYSFWVP